MSVLDKFDDSRIAILEIKNEDAPKKTEPSLQGVVDFTTERGDADRYINWELHGMRAGSKDRGGFNYY